MQDYYIAENTKLKTLLDKAGCKNCKKTKLAQNKALIDMSEHLNQVEDLKKHTISDSFKTTQQCSKLSSNSQIIQKQSSKIKRQSMISRNKKQITPQQSSTINNSSRGQKIVKQSSSAVRQLNKKVQLLPKRAPAQETNKENSRQLFSSVLVPPLKDLRHLPS